MYLQKLQYVGQKSKTLKNENILIEKIAGKLFNSSILDYIAFSESIKKEEGKI